MLAVVLIKRELHAGLNSSSVRRHSLREQRRPWQASPLNVVPVRVRVFAFPANSGSGDKPTSGR